MDNSEIFPWDLPETHPKRGKEFDPGFEEHMTRSLRNYDKYQGLMAGELKIKVRKHISVGRHDCRRRDELVIEWEGYQELLVQEQERMREAHATRTQPAVQQELRSYEVPIFPFRPYSEHQRWAEEYLALGEEAFEQKYPWLAEWIIHLERSNDRVLLRKINKL